jgi:peroxiredoxin
MKSLEEAYEQLAQLNTVPFGIGVDSDPSNKAWAKTMGVVKTRLLADFWPHGRVAMQYGVFEEIQGVSKRANVLIDENGVVFFSKLYPGDELPDIHEIIQVIQNRSPGCLEKFD